MSAYGKGLLYALGLGAIILICVMIRVMKMDALALGKKTRPNNGCNVQSTMPKLLMDDPKIMPYKDTLPILEAAMKRAMKHKRKR